MQYSKTQNAALLLLRIVIAAIFLAAAYAKIPFWSMKPGEMSAGMINLTKFLSIVEPLGAIAVLVGFLTKWAAAGLGIIMIGAIYACEFWYGIGFVMPTGAGWNFNLTILAGCIILIAFGAGDWGVGGRGRKIMLPR